MLFFTECRGFSAGGLGKDYANLVGSPDSYFFKTRLLY